MEADYKKESSHRLLRVEKAPEREGGVKVWSREGI